MPFLQVAGIFGVVAVEVTLEADKFFLQYLVALGFQVVVAHGLVAVDTVFVPLQAADAHMPGMSKRPCYKKCK